MRARRNCASSHTQIASSIARRVLSRAPEARLSAVDFGSVDALKVASAVARRLEVLREKPVDATALVASAIARHLATPKLQGSSQAAQRLHARVASAVGYAPLQVKKAGGKDEQPAKAPAAGSPKPPTPGKA